MAKHVFSMAAFAVLCGACAGSALAAHGGAWPLQKRIDEIAAKGGGTLVLTAGVYRTGAIFFKPGVNLHLEKGATIFGTMPPSNVSWRFRRQTCAVARSGPILVEFGHRRQDTVAVQQRKTENGTDKSSAYILPDGVFDGCVRQNGDSGGN